MAGPINQITTMRLPDGTEVAFVDWSDTPLYSTCELLANFTDTEIDLFQYVAGEPIPTTNNALTRRTSNDRDTNVVTPGGMASTEELLVYAIKPDFYEFTTDDGDPRLVSVPAPNQPAPTRKRLSILHAALLVSLDVSQKFTHRAGLSYYNTGFGASATTVFAGAVAVAGQPGLTAANAGWPAQDAVRSLVVPIHIGGQEKYRLRLENVSGNPVPSGLSEANPGVSNDNILHRIVFHLDGLYKRPVA